MSQQALTTNYSGVLLEISAAEAANLDERGVPRTIGRQFRRVQVAAYDAEKHTVSMAVSSETPVERGYGVEILSHEKGALRTGRLKSGIPLLFNHDMDQHLGRSLSWDLADGVLHVTNRFGGNPLALEKEGDVASEILVDVSIAYQVYEWEITENAQGVRKYLAVDWEIFENSLVTVPADPTVGVGRSAPDAVEVKVRSFHKDEDSAVEAALELAAPAAADDATRSLTPPADEAPTPESPTPEAQRTITMEPNTPVVPVGPDPAVVEASRVAGLTALRTNYPAEFSETALRTAIALDMPLERAKAAVADAVIAGAQRNDVPTVAEELFGSMSDKERRSYSLRNAYAAALNMRSPGTFSDKGAEAGFEKEVSTALRKMAGERGIEGMGGGLIIPSQATRTSFGQQQRTIASGGNAGTYTNFTDVAVDPIELLRSRVYLLQLGATFLTGLKGKIQMPRQSAAASSNWVAEASAGSNSDLVLDDITMTPNRLTMVNSYYRDFFAQSALAIDSLLANDRMQVLARSLNTAAIGGSGTAPVPTGLLNRSGLAAVLTGTVRATNGTVTAGLGGVPLTFVDVNNMESSIATSNGDIGTLRWLTTPKVRGAARSTPKIPGTASEFLWPTAGGGANGMGPGPLGYDAICTSDAVLTGFTANSVANLHAIILGVWDQMLIGDWGLSELVVDNVTGAASAKVIITEHAFYDTNIRHLASFCACTSALPS